jgi:phosphoglucomutase
MSLKIETVPTKPFAGQKPGTSGLRKKVKEVQQPHYLENFVQCIFSSLPPSDLPASTLVVSGDGRYHNDTAVITILRMAAAQRVGRVILGQHNLMSTPCVSAIIRKRKAYGGIILTASHNPGGPTEDFGIKYNCENGGPAPESLTDKMFALSKEIKEYYIVNELPNIDVSTIGEYKYGDMIVEVVDAPKEYSELMQSIFDFPLLKRFLVRSDFTFIYDTMHGVAGPFAHRVFVEELGASASALMNAKPLPDFGGGHPDPNLTYAEDLVVRMGLPAASAHAHGSHAEDGGHAHGEGAGSRQAAGGVSGQLSAAAEVVKAAASSAYEKMAAAVSSVGGGGKIPDFGAASDGDADRNMILGAKFFVTPSDSVAIIAANSQFIPYFAKGGVKGVARSMPTSQALDRVAEKRGLKCYEVPTGWKFFGNLMDDGKLSICGEESFGTGSDHIREKDGMWAILAWLSILAGRNQSSAEGRLISVRQIVEEHWAQYGRNYYSRYDYEQVDSAAADKVMSTLLTLIPTAKGQKWEGFEVKDADEFTYRDPVDHSVSEHQGIRFQFIDGSRIVFRLSGTGSVGATIRVYVERYEQKELGMETASAVAPLIKIALLISKMQELTGRDKPTVIT